MCHVWSYDHGPAIVQGAATIRPVAGIDARLALNPAGRAGVALGTAAA
jgi:hypothetical protein